MRYIRGYKSFVNESKKQFDKNSLIVEKQTLNEFSNNFWNLCQNSSVFTLEEKQYISTISHTKVKLNEEWDWLDKTWDWAKEKGGKLLDSIKGKISALIKGMKNFVKSVIEFAKKLWTGLLNSAKKLGKDIATKQKDKISASMKDSKEEDKNSEWKNLIDTMKHWGYGVSAAGEVIDEKLSGATDKVVALFNNSAADAESKSIDGLNDIDLTEATANESNIFDTTEDVLIHFYNTEINESTAESTAEATVGATQWLLNFIGSDQVKPEAKAGDKLLWWGKLLLKILSFVLSPLIKIGEEILKYTSKYVLDGLSWLTKTLGGPGAFKFVVLGGAIATVVGTATEAALLAGIHIPGWEQMEAVIHWISHALGHAIEAGIPGFDWIKILCKILGAFCLGMTLLHLYHELHHVVKGGHGEHDTHEKPEETEAKPEVKSETKPTTPSAKPEVKTETKPTTPEAKPQAKPEVKTEVKK